MENRPPVHLLVGSLDDPHVASVLSGLPQDRSIVLDASNVTEVVQEVTEDQMILRSINDGSIVIDDQTRATGWIRRIAPAGWDDQVTIGTHRAATLASRLALLAGVIRSAGICWMTPLDALSAAENKIVQYRAARRLRIGVPRTVIGPRADELEIRLGRPFVMKPLGPGAFVNETGEQRVVYATSVDSNILSGTDLQEAPFIAQEQLTAISHLRVVTVGDRAWVNELPAVDVPLDWRTLEKAHSDFVTSSSHQETGELAVALAADLGCFYSSQDWILEQTGARFVDLNPNGQWLFLPNPCAQEVSDALIEHMHALACR